MRGSRLEQGWGKGGAGAKEVAEELEGAAACPRGHSGSLYRDLPRAHGACPHAVEGPALVL